MSLVYRTLLDIVLSSSIVRLCVFNKTYKFEMCMCVRISVSGKFNYDYLLNNLVAWGETTPPFLLYILFFPVTQV